MSERITRADLDRICETVSEGLEGIETRTGFLEGVRAQGRNGYIGLDLYQCDGAQVDTLMIGTKREVYTYLQGMRRAQMLAHGVSYGA